MEPGKLEKISELRRGVFDGFELNGIKFRTEAGSSGWRLTIVKDHDIHTYWKEGDVFRELSTHIFPPDSRADLVYGIGDVVEVFDRGT